MEALVDSGVERIAALLMRHRTALYAYLLAAVRNPHDAEDLLQEVSVTVIRRWDAFEPGTSFPAWSREIARRHILDFAGRAKRVTIDPALLDALDAAGEIETDRRRDALRECLRALGGPARRVIDLRYAGAMDVPRIADSIGRTVQATYALLKRAREILRECADRKLVEYTA